MRNGMAWLVCVLVFVVGGLATWSLTRGQAPPPSTESTNPNPTPVPPSASPADPPAANPTDGLVPPRTVTPREDTSPGDFGLRKQIDYSMNRGAQWLFRMNTVSGRFLPGFLPSVSAVMEGDDYLRQAGAALALARAARQTTDRKQAENYAARATQAVLALLDDTETEGEVRHLRRPASANLLAAAGLLVAAINELPQPPDDILQKSDELCLYIRKLQQTDGSLRWTEGDDKAAADSEGVNLYPGPALYGLMRSQERRPAAWKTDLVRKALAYYGPWWHSHRSMTFVPWQTAVYTEAFLLTKEKPFADFVCDMNDWLCERRYEALDPNHPKWFGGFRSWADGKDLATAPDASSACYAESLAEACRVTRALADLPRHQRYKTALESSLQFLVTLQYTDGNTLHFAPEYREAWLVGGFHGSHKDGDLRLDYTQHAVCAMIGYLAHVAE